MPILRRIAGAIGRLHLVAARAQSLVRNGVPATDIGAHFPKVRRRGRQTTAAHDPAVGSGVESPVSAPEVSAAYIPAPSKGSPIDYPTILLLLVDLH